MPPKPRVISPCGYLISRRALRPSDSTDYHDFTDSAVCGNSYDFVPDSKLAEFLAQYEGMQSPLAIGWSGNWISVIVWMFQNVNPCSHPLKTH
jgi:hypothetical protein